MAGNNNNNLKTLKKLYNDVAENPSNSNIEELITFLEEVENEKILSLSIPLLDLPEGFEIPEAGLPEQVINKLLDLITPGYAYHRRTFDLFTIWHSHALLPQDLELHRLKLGWLYKGIFARTERALKSEQEVLKKNILTFFEENPDVKPLKFQKAFNLEDPADVELKGLLEKMVAGFQLTDQLKYLQLVSEEIRESMQCPAQVIANRIERLLPEGEKHKDLVILVAGKSGIGKSTLANVTVGIPPDSPDATLEVVGGDRGTRDLVSVKKTFIGAERGVEFEVELIDTPGFELDEAQQMEVQNMIEKRVLNGLVKSGVQPVNFIVYCLPASVNRVDLKEQEFIRTLSTFAPIIIVYLKAYSDSLAEPFNEYFDGLRVPINIKSRIPVYARAEKSGFPETPRNLTLFARAIVDNYLDSIEKIEEHSQAIASTKEIDMINKWNNANYVVYTATLAAGGVGAVPIPFGDLPALMGIQTGMIAGINFAYGIPVISNVFNILLTAVCGSASGKLIQVGLSAAKAIPGLNILSSVLSSATAGATTLSLGYCYAVAIDKTIRAHPTFLSYNEEEKAEIIAKNIYDAVAEKAKKDTSSIWDEVTQAAKNSSNPISDQ